MADNPFRVLLDLTDLYLQDFKYVWLLISPRELKTISGFKKYALRRLNLEQEDVQIFLRDGLLLDNETILVLREDDTVQIKYKNLIYPIKEESADSSRKRNIIESEDDGNAKNSKRQKSEDVTQSSIKNKSFVVTSFNKGRKTQAELPVNFENCHFTLVGKEKEVSLNPDNSWSLKENSKEKKRKQTDSSVNFEIDSTAVIEENHLVQKSHKKKDKKKSVSFDLTSIEDVNLDKSIDSFDPNKNAQPKQSKSTNAASEETQLESEYMEVLNTHSQSKEVTLHKNESSVVAEADIHPVDSGTEKGSKRKRKRNRKRKQSSSFDVSDSCDVMDNLKLNLEIEGDQSKDIQQADAPKMSTPAKPESCSIPDLQLALVPYKNTNLSYAEANSKLDKKSAKKCSTQNKGIKSEEKSYEDLPSLTSLPSVGIHLAYKALELDENYTPTTTAYREGIVQKVNLKTEEIEIQLKKEVILPARSGRFENLGKDEVPEPTIKKYEVLKWCNMISPKILS